MPRSTSRPERFSVVFPEDGTEPYVVLPLGSNWPSHPEAAAIENLIWDSGHRDRAWGMTVSRCMEARAIAGRHARGVDALGEPVSTQVRDGARRVLKKLDTGLRALAAQGVAGAAEALGEGTTSSARAVASSGGASRETHGTPQRSMFVLTWNPQPQNMSPAELAEHRDYWLDKIESTEGDATSDGCWSTGSRRGDIKEDDDLVLFLHGAGAASSRAVLRPARSTKILLTGRTGSMSIGSIGWRQRTACRPSSSAAPLPRGSSSTRREDPADDSRTKKLSRSGTPGRNCLSKLSRSQETRPGCALPVVRRCRRERSVAQR